MAELLAAGLEITLLGMGVVFVLLTALVFVVQGMSWLAHRLGGPPDLTPAGDAPPGDTRLTAAIAAAIHAYRSGKSGHGRDS